MRKALLFLPFLLSHTLSAQPPSIQWQKTIGGTAYDNGGVTIPTLDGGYILAASTYSTDHDAPDNHGQSDALLVKMSATGAVQWKKCYGGSSSDGISSIRQLADSGYIMAGSSFSSDGDLTANQGFNDCWVARLNASGQIIWQRSYGGSSHEDAIDIIATADKGYIFTGFTQSNDGDVSGGHGVNTDYWVVKLDSTGAIQWQKCLGGTDQETPRSIVQTADGGYVVSGYSGSSDGDVTGQHGGWDIWVVKLSPSGAIQWQKALGGSSYEAIGTLIKTADGGFAVSGFTSSVNGDVNYGSNPSTGTIDAWLVKLDSAGAIQWQRPVGGNKADVIVSLCQTPDNGFVAAGGTQSSLGLGATGFHGGEDVWVLRFDAAGSLQWQGVYGGSDTERATAVIPCTDGGLLLTGTTKSNNGDVTGRLGSYDGWLVKLSAPSGIAALPALPAFTLYPNPAAQQLYIRNAPEGSHLRILDVLGREVLRAGGQVAELHIGSLSPGRYQVVITDKSGRALSRPLVKE